MKKCTPLFTFYIELSFMKWLSAFLLILISIVLGGFTVNQDLASTSPINVEENDHFANGKFHNTEPMMSQSLSKTLEIAVRFFSKDSKKSVPQVDIPMEMLSAASLDKLPSDNVFMVKLGHSSVLLKVYGEYWLYDPVFSDRASPFSFMGPKRFHDTPISIEELPAIDRVFISHNHYDHLDKKAVKALESKTKHFYVPLGVEADLERWGIPSDKILRFDWWQEQRIGETLIAFTPTKHFSGRSLTDGNKTLWGSWVVKTPKASLYFSGDSGYFDGFKKIGQKYGPFDLTLIETGAYDKDWADIHMTPEQSVQAHIDLQGKHMMPIHNGTFDLAFHDWQEPLELAFSEAQTKGVNIVTPLVGTLFAVEQPETKETWWRDLI